MTRRNERQTEPAPERSSAADAGPLTGEVPSASVVEIEVALPEVGRDGEAHLVHELLGVAPNISLEAEIDALKRIYASEDLRNLQAHIEELEAQARREEASRKAVAQLLERLEKMAKSGRQVVLEIGQHKVRALVSLGAGVGAVGIGTVLFLAFRRAHSQRRRDH